MSKNINKEAAELIEELRNTAASFLKSIKAQHFWPDTLAPEQEKRVELFSYILTLIPKEEIHSSECEKLEAAVMPGKDI